MGLKATTFTGLSCGSGSLSGFPVVASQSRAVYHAAGQDRLAIGTESDGRQLTVMPQGSPRGLPVAAFQSLAVLSVLAVRTVFPSGLKAAATTLSSCCKGRARGWPVVASQSRAVLSRLHVSSVLPSRVKATSVTVPLCRKGGPSGCPVSASQRPRGAMYAAGEETLAVGTQGGGDDVLCGCEKAAREEEERDASRPGWCE